MDNERNWRFRLELAHQLGQLGPVFESQDIREHLAPIALTLIQVQLFIASYYKQLSADIKISTAVPKARANKTGFDIMIVHFYIRKNWI